MAARPSVVILAGPNGAGKSTAAPLLLGEARLHAQVFVNADEIAAERSPADGLAPTTITLLSRHS
jgi:predicted ABC-type ATPase